MFKESLSGLRKTWVLAGIAVFFILSCAVAVLFFLTLKSNNTYGDDSQRTLADFSDNQSARQFCNMYLVASIPSDAKIIGLKYDGGFSWKLSCSIEFKSKSETEAFRKQLGLSSCKWNKNSCSCESSNGMKTEFIFTDDEKRVEIHSYSRDD